jgi:hypothetical protein
MSSVAQLHEKVMLDRRRLWWWLAILTVVCVCGIVGGVWIWHVAHARRVQAMLAAAQMRGEPTSTHELNAFHRARGDEEDASRFWIAGIEPLIQPGHSAAEANIAVLSQPRFDLNALDTISEPEVAAIREFLKSNAHSIAQFHSAAELGGAGRLPVDFSAGVGTLLPYTQGARNAARLLQLEILIQARDGDPRECAKAMTTLLLLSRSLEKEPTVVSQLVGMAIERLSVDMLASALGRVEFEAQELARFAKIIRARDARERLRTGLLGERVMGIAAYDNPQSLMEGRPRTLITQADLALYLEYIDSLIETSRLEFPVCIAAADAAQTKMEASSGQGFGVLTAGLTRALNADFKKGYFPNGAVTEAKNRAALAAIAVIQFRNERGALPGSLADLSPAYLPAPLIDPFTGGPMQMRITDAGYLLYSLGEDRLDEQGADVSKPDPGVYLPLKRP